VFLSGPAAVPIVHKWKAKFNSFSQMSILLFFLINHGALMHCLFTERGIVVTTFDVAFGSSEDNNGQVCCYGDTPGN